MYPLSTGDRATRSGSWAHSSAALSTARTARFVATGWLRPSSLRPTSMQQKYCDHGRSNVCHQVADLAGAKLLRTRSKCEIRVDRLLGEAVDGVDRARDDPTNVLAWVHSDMREHTGSEDVLGLAQAEDCDGLTLQVTGGADALGSEELEAPDMDTRQDYDRLDCIDTNHERSNKVERQVDVAGHQTLLLADRADFLDVLDVGESLRPQQFLGHVLGSDADRADLRQSEPRRLRRRLGLGRARPRAEDSRGSRHGRPQETPSIAHDHPFSSLFSSLKKRQSVPWATILLGPLLMSPASCRRSDQKRTVSVGSNSRHRLYGRSFRAWSVYS